MDPAELIYVAGHAGLAGSAICRELKAQGFTRLLLASHNQCDLRREHEAERLFAIHQPRYVILAAARVGGIIANSTAPADFIHDNLRIQTNVIDAAHRFGCRRLLFLGSSCIYPRLTEQPIREEALGTGRLEPTNEAYAWAKLAGIAMARAYRQQHGMETVSVMPTNLYGPGDRFEPHHGHLVPGLMVRMHEAKQLGAAQLSVWGSGAPRRELLHVDDLARACVMLMKHPDPPELVNVGTGTDLAIRDVAGMVAEAVGYKGELVFDPSKPDGTPRKLLSVARMHAMGWRAEIPLELGLRETYDWYKANIVRAGR